VSAGRVITKMAFDTKSPTPKVLFSPAGKVEDSDLPIIAQQAKSAAAEAAVKMNVFQSDNSSETEVAQPQSAREEVAQADIPEPVKRESTKTAPSDEKDISDVVKKWSKK
jgi:hypothetical protein